MKKITYELVKSFNPCYDPTELGIDTTLELTPKEFIEQFRDRVKKKEDILWILLRPDFLNDKDLRLFAVWCAKEALKLVEDPDLRSADAGSADTGSFWARNVAERYANGEATQDELNAARSAAASAAWSAASATWSAASATWSAVASAARSAASAARSAAARSAAESAQIDQLLNYFK
jgi:hypothetical protein